MAKQSNADKVKNVLRERIIKQGHRGLGLTSLTNHAKSVNKNYNSGNVRKLLKAIGAQEVREDVYSINYV